MVDLEIGSDGEDWSGIIAFRMNGRIPEILIFDYTKNSRTCKKMPGGCCAAGENPLDALGNEVTQETGLELISMEPVIHCWTNKKVPGVHHQHFFATPANNLQGILREDDLPDGDEILGPPEWMPVAVAVRVLFFSHRQGLMHALPLIALTDEAFYHAVSKFL